MMFISRIARLRTAALATALMALAPAGAIAQQAPNAPAQAQTEISDAKLESFAEAVVAVQEVRMTYDEALQSAEGEEEKASLQQEAQDEMLTAIEDQGLTVQEYQTVAQAVQSDPALWEKVQQHLNQ